MQNSDPKKQSETTEVPDLPEDLGTTEATPAPQPDADGDEDDEEKETEVLEGAGALVD